VTISKVAVFCGARDGARPAYRASAVAFGKALAERSMALVYGGGSTGLMGAVADGALQGRGEVIGVIPKGLARAEFAHLGLTALHYVATMHQRKALMEELSDAFVALPGGYGTLDELMEIVTWAQIGLHTKPIGLLNVEGYFDPLLAFVQRAVDDGFISPGLGSVLCVERTPEALLTKLLTHQPPAPAVQWIGPKKGAG
jgi:uncharacterized protein (TIGR00730 family)